MTTDQQFFWLADGGLPRKTDRDEETNRRIDSNDDEIRMDDNNNNNENTNLDYYNQQVEVASAYHDFGIDLAYGVHDSSSSSYRTEAIQFLRQAVQLRESLLGKNHPDTALTNFRIASVLGQDGGTNVSSNNIATAQNEDTMAELREALSFSRRELRITWELLGGSMTTKVNSKYNIGTDLGYIDDDDHDESLETRISNLLTNQINLTSSSTMSSQPSQPMWLQERMGWIEDYVVRLMQFDMIINKGRNRNVVSTLHDDIQQQATKYTKNLLKTIELERMGDAYLKQDNSNVNQNNLEIALTCYNNAIALESNAFDGTYNELDVADLHIKAAACLVELQKVESTTTIETTRRRGEEGTNDRRQPKSYPRRSVRQEDFYESALMELDIAEQKYRKFTQKNDHIGDKLTLWNSKDVPLKHNSKLYQLLSSKPNPSPACIGNVMSKKAAILLRQKRFDDALATYAKVYTTMEETFGKYHTATKEVLADIRLVTVREQEDFRTRYSMKKKQTQKIRR